MRAGALFEATFAVAEIDISDDPKTGARTKLKKFESVSRLKGNGVGKKDAAEKLHIVLDYNCDIYPLEEGQKIVVMLADEEHGEALAEDYEYAMHGRIFKYNESDGIGVVYASFGGLMLQLSVPPSILSPKSFNINDPVYILVKLAH